MEASLRSERLGRLQQALKRELVSVGNRNWPPVPGAALQIGDMVSVHANPAGRVSIAYAGRRQGGKQRWCAARVVAGLCIWCHAHIVL